MNPANANARAHLRIYIALLLSCCVASAGITVIYTMLPVLYRQFPNSPYVGWAVTIYWLGAAVSAAICGRLGDLLGYRKLLLTVMFLCTIGAVMSALSSGLTLLIAGCAIQAIAASITPLSMGIVRENLPVEKIPFAVGIIGAGGMVSAGLVYVSSGAVIDNFSWQGGFWFKVVLAAMAITAVLVFIPRSHPKTGTRINYAIGLIFAPALCAILFAIQNLREWGLGDRRFWSLIVVGFMILGVWGRHQWVAKHPLINVRMLGHRQVILANICMMFIALGGMQLGQIFSLLYQQPTWTQTGLGLSATYAGALMLSGNVFALLGSPWSGRIAIRYSARRAALLGLSFMIVAWGALIICHSGLIYIIPEAMLCSFSLAFAQTAVYNLIIEATPPERTGEATGMLYVFFACFFAIGSQMAFMTLRSTSVSNGSVSFPADAGYVASFTYVTLMSIGGFLVAWALPRRGKPALSASPADVALAGS